MAESSPAVSMGSALTPIQSHERSMVLDGLRGFAVLGILAMNIGGFALPEADFFNPRTGGLEGVDGAVWWFQRLVFDMKMQSLFSMLFGAGLVVLSVRARRAGRSSGAIFYRRVAVLAVMGILHAYLLWYGDILWTYAVCGALIYPLHRLSNIWLAILGSMLFLIGAIASSGVGAAMWFLRDAAESAQAVIDSGGTPSEFQSEMLTGWKEMSADFNPGADAIEKELAAHRGSFLDTMMFRAPGALEFQIGIPFWMFSIWRFSGYMLMGVALMRSGVFTGGLSSRTYAWMMALGYAIGFPIVIAGGVQAWNSGFDFILTFLTGWQWNYLGSIFVALGHVGALMLLFRSPAMDWILRPLAATGRMALTNYLSQSLLCAFIFFGWGLGMWGRLTRAEVAGVVVLIWSLQIAWSVWWLARFRMGPMEWVWRWLTYGEKPAMRLAVHASAAPG